MQQIASAAVCPHGRTPAQVCLRFKDAGDSSIEATALPDVRGWQYGGEQQLNGEAVRLWQYEARWAVGGAGRHRKQAAIGHNKTGC